MIAADFRPERKTHPGLRVTDLSAYRRFYSYDPVGNRLEFLEPGV